MAKKIKRVVNVRVEKLQERYLGNPTGSIIYHVSEAGCSSGLFRGCPLGRGYTEASAIADFCFRANLDDSALKLQTTEIKVQDRWDYSKS